MSTKFMINQKTLAMCYMCREKKYYSQPSGQPTEARSQPLKLYLFRVQEFRTTRTAKKDELFSHFSFLAACLFQLLVATSSHQPLLALNAKKSQYRVQVDHFLLVTLCGFRTVLYIVSFFVDPWFFCSFLCSQNQITRQNR